MYVAGGVLVLEASLKVLERPSQLRNFKVFTIISTDPTGDRIGDLLTRRVLLTENTEDYWSWPWCTSSASSTPGTPPRIWKS